MERGFSYDKDLGKTFSCKFYVKIERDTSLSEFFN